MRAGACAVTAHVLRQARCDQWSRAMIARLWWPWLSWCLGNRWLIDAAVLLLVALVTSMAHEHLLPWSSFSTTQQVAIGLAVLLMWYAAGRPGAGLGAILAMALGAVAAWTLGPQSADGITVLITLAAALQVPQLIELRTARHRDEALRASARGLGVLLPGTALAAPALVIIGGWPLLAGGAVAAFAAMVIPLTWCRLEAEPAPLLPSPLPPRMPHLLLARGMQMAVLGMVTLGLVDVVAHLLRTPVPLWQLLSPLAVMALWHAVTGQVVLSVIVALSAGGWLGFAFLGDQPWRFDLLISALALGQVLPLTLWFARRHHRRWPALLLIAMAVIPALALPGAFSAIGGAALTACLAVVVCHPRPVAAVAARGLIDGDTALLQVRRACQRLPPYWRHYGSAKLRYDPVYRQLASHPLPWGRVLDAGCGPGLVAALAAVRTEPAYCGIDLDETKLEAAADLLEQLGQPLGGEWRLLKARLPLPQMAPGRFDTALLIDVLHYWPEAEQVALLRQVHGALDRGGRLFLRDGILDGDGGTGAVGLSERFTTFFGLNPGGSGLHFLSEEVMREHLEACGLRVLTCLPSGGANRLWTCEVGVPPAASDEVSTGVIPMLGS